MCFTALNTAELYGMITIPCIKNILSLVLHLREYIFVNVMQRALHTTVNVVPYILRQLWTIYMYVGLTWACSNLILRAMQLYTTRHPEKTTISVQQCKLAPCNV